MAKNRPTKEMFGQIMRKPIPFRKETNTGIAKLDNAISWLSENSASLLDIAVAKEAIPLLMAATRIGGHVSVCHENQGFTASIKQSLLIHRIRDHLFINKSIRTLPTRFKRDFDAILALDLSTANAFEKALDILSASLVDGGKALISAKRDIFNTSALDVLGETVQTGTYDSLDETYVFAAVVKKGEPHA